MNFKNSILSIGFIFGIICISYSQTITEKILTTGPKNGSLVIVGGGKSVEKITKKFIELAGGINAPIVVIPTAGGRDTYDDNSSGARLIKNMGPRTYMFFIQMIRKLLILTLSLHH